MGWGEALSQARKEHTTRIVWGSVFDGDSWACSCGKQGRDQKKSLKKMTHPMAQAAANRHVEAAARRIQKAAS